MAVVDVRIDGIDELVNALIKMPDNGKGVLHSAVNKGAQYLEPRIRGAIERGEGKNGHLKDAVRVRKAKPQKRIRQSADIVAGKGKKIDYGFHVEVGTKNMKGKGHMRQATDSNSEQVANIVMDEIEKVLEV